MDLAQEVATNVGAAKIVGKEASIITAAAMIHRDMRVDNPDGSDIIRIVYRHKDPDRSAHGFDASCEDLSGKPREDASIKRPGR